MTNPEESIAKVIRVVASSTPTRPATVGSRAIPRGADRGQARVSQLIAASLVLSLVAVGCGGGSANSMIGACSNVVATGSPGLIDDLSHTGAMIPNNDGRQGEWSTWNDGTGTQTPPGVLGDTCGATTFEPTNGQACTSGTGFTASGAGISVGVAGGANCKSCNYDASAYKGGVRFTISGSVTGNLRFLVNTAEVVDVRFGGLCTDGTKCWDGYGVDLTVTTQPQVVEIAWTSLHQQGWGTPALFDLRHIQILNWNVNKIGSTPVSFDNLCIDDVSFF
jgi:hypothetical protein